MTGLGLGPPSGRLRGPRGPRGRGLGAWRRGNRPARCGGRSLPAAGLPMGSLGRGTCCCHPWTSLTICNKPPVFSRAQAAQMRGSCPGPCMERVFGGGDPPKRVRSVPWPQGSGQKALRGAGVPPGQSEPPAGGGCEAPGSREQGCVGRFPGPGGVCWACHWGLEADRWSHGDTELRRCRNTGVGWQEQPTLWVGAGPGTPLRLLWCPNGHVTCRCFQGPGVTAGGAQVLSSQSGKWLCLLSLRTRWGLGTGNPHGRLAWAARCRPSRLGQGTHGDVRGPLPASDGCFQKETGSLNRARPLQRPRSPVPTRASF